jgi:DNA-binding CsgD family transcriptional regulator
MDDCLVTPTSFAHPLADASAPGCDMASNATKLRIREQVEVLQLSRCNAPIVSILDRIGCILGLPLVILARDLAQPYGKSTAQGFSRCAMWSGKTMEDWQDSGGALREVLYRRCRLSHLPFAVTAESMLREIPHLRRRKVERLAEICFRDLGLHSFVTVPVHLPLARIAMLAWAGPLPIGTAEALLTDIGVELMIAAQCGVGILDGGANAQIAHADTFELTPREWDCLRLVAQGFRDADVARLIGISPTTARYYIDQAVRKMNAANRTHAVALAAQQGLLGPIGI